MINDQNILMVTLIAFIVLMIGMVLYMYWPFLKNKPVKTEPKNTMIIIKYPNCAQKEYTVDNNIESALKRGEVIDISIVGASEECISIRKRQNN